MSPNRYRCSVLSLLLVILALTSCSTDNRQVVEEYLLACNAHNVDRVVSLITDDFIFAVAGGLDIKGVDQNRGVTQYDSVMNVELTMRDISAVGDTVGCTVIETNDWLTVSGMDSAVYAVKFVLRDGLIAAILATPSPETKAGFGAVVRPMMQWASVNRPEEVSALMPDGVFVYNAETAGPALALLREWVSSQAK
jgi:hypothetical protein